MKHTLSVREVWGSIPGPVKLDVMSPAARYRSDVSSEMCCPGAKPRRWTLPLVARFGVYREYNITLGRNTDFLFTVLRIHELSASHT